MPDHESDKNAIPSVAQYTPIGQNRLQQSCRQNARDHLFMRSWFGHAGQQGIVP